MRAPQAANRARLCPASRKAAVQAARRVGRGVVDIGMGGTARDYTRRAPGEQRHPLRRFARLWAKMGRRAPSRPRGALERAKGNSDLPTWRRWKGPDRGGTVIAVKRPKLWTPGDWNAFFGFGTNILVNLLVLTGLLRFVLHMPDEVVLGRILPACGLMLFTSTLYYAWLAYQLAKETGRPTCRPRCPRASRAAHVRGGVRDHAAHRPQDRRSGQGMGGRPHLGIHSELRAHGRRLHRPYIRKITPRAALLGTLAGVSIAFISLRPALEMFMTPIIGVVCSPSSSRAGSAACAISRGSPRVSSSRVDEAPGALPQPAD